MTPTVLKLRELRQARGLTQEQLATAAGIRRATISDLENGASRSDTLDLIDRLCRALDCDPGELIVRTSRKGKR